MEFIARVLMQGGPVVWAVLPLALVGGLLAIALPMVIGFLKWRLPASVSWLGILLPLIVGVLGTAWGMQMTWDAVGFASAEMRDTMAAAGASVALYTSVLALMTCIPIALLACIATAIPAVAAVGPDARFDLRGLLVSAGVALVGGVLALGAVAAALGASGLVDSGMALPISVVVAIVATLFSVVACMRIASEDHMHQGRIAGSRFLVGMTGALAVILVGETFRAMGLIMATEALALASPEMRPVLQAAGLQLASNAAWIGWLLACVPAATGAAGAMHWVRRVEGRNAIGAVLMLVLFTGIVGLIYAARAMSVLAVSGL